MIDLKTGRIEINEVLIKPYFSIKDFEKYDDSKIYVFNRGYGRGIINFVGYVNSNGIDAQIIVEINEKLNTRRIVITPSLNGTSGMKLLDASKIWLRGMANGQYTETTDSISGEYEWGQISAQYREDRDYGVVGGEIIIDYGVSIVPKLCSSKGK